jgi:hypothetical protein
MFSLHPQNYVNEFINIYQTGLDYEKVFGFSKYLKTHNLYPIKELNNILVMEDEWSLRFGRKFHGYLFFLSETISFGLIKNSILPFNFLVIVTVSFITFLKLNKNFNFLFAFIFINFLMAHPWLINEFYIKQNIQGYPIILNLLISIIFIDYIKNYKKIIPVKNIIIITALISLFYKINEINLLCLVQLIFIIFFLVSNYKKKISYLLVVSATFFLVNKSLDLYFNYKVTETKQYVSENGGKVFDLDYETKHIKWTAFYMSLNEFEKHINTGFWDDWLTYPIIFQENNLKKDNKIFETSNNGYIIHPHSYKNTEEIFKRKSLDIIQNNKLLLIKLIYLRISYYFQNLSPLGINFLYQNIYIFDTGKTNTVLNFGLLILFFVIYNFKNNKKIYFVFILTLFSILPGLVFKVTHGISYSYIGHYIIFAYILADISKKLWKKYLKY